MASKPDNTRKLSADKIVVLPISEVRPYDKNPRKNEKAVKYVKESIRQFGFKVPIVIDSNRVIVCGHTRLLAAKSLGMTEVPCIMADDLTDDQIKAFRLADNKVGEFAEWDLDLLGDELDAIADASDIDMGDFGFDLSETEEEKEVVEDEVPEEVEPVCQRGEIWQLGEHRLMCGDSTKAENFEKLMGGERADMCFTSPPYNNAGNAIETGNFRKGAKSQKLYGEQGYTDDRESNDYIKLCRDVLDNMFKFTDGYIFWNVNYNANARSEYIRQVIDKLDYLSDLICWKKRMAITNTVGGLTRIWEPIYVFSTDKKPLKVNCILNNHWEVDNVNASYENHRACFPVALPGKAIQSVAKEVNIVLDPFGGSGSTMIAAEQLGRKCFMMEMDPHYCDVIITRWEKLTGQKAVKVED